MFRYLMRKWRLLRVLLSIVVGWLVIYYYVSIYHPSLFQSLLPGHHMKVMAQIGKGRTACDFLKSGPPLNTSYVYNPDLYDNVIVPKTDCNPNINIVVFVHSSPHFQHRRDTIRKTWGNVSQYDMPMRVVFVLGEIFGDDNIEKSSKDALKKEILKYNDIIQSNFVDTYRNLSYKAIAGLKWVIHNCRPAQFILKTDDDAFVNVYLLLRLIRTENYEENMLVCNVRNATSGETPIDRSGKWKATEEECSLKDLPTFCQGLAFLMTMKVAVTLYDASKYVPMFWMDDVYITGFLPALLPPNSVVHLHAGPFYMSAAYVNKTTSHRVLAGPDAFKFIFYHDDDMKLVETAWNNLKQVVLTQTFSNYSDAMLGKDMQLERKRLKNVTCTEWSRARDLCYLPKHKK